MIRATVGTKAFSARPRRIKANAIWRVYDLDTSANVKVTGNAGTTSPQTIVDAEPGCFP